MVLLSVDDPLAVEVVGAIRSGAVAHLGQLLAEHPPLAAARVGDQCESRTLLHVATDWPGHHPDGPATVDLLVQAGADVHARFVGGHRETALHWAASSGDVAVLNVLVGAGADVQADGGVVDEGTPLADAVAFGQWQAARRLLAHGARPNLWQAAALGLTDVVGRRLAGPPPAAPQDVTRAFWCACHGGQRATAEQLRDQGADLNWVGFDGLSPLDAAVRVEAHDLVRWLQQVGARPASPEGAG